MELEIVIIDKHFLYDLVCPVSRKLQGCCSKVEHGGNWCYLPLRCHCAQSKTVLSVSAYEAEGSSVNCHFRNMFTYVYDWNFIDWIIDRNVSQEQFNRRLSQNKWQFPDSSVKICFLVCLALSQAEYLWVFNWTKQAIWGGLAQMLRSFYCHGDRHPNQYLKKDDVGSLKLMYTAEKNNCQSCNSGLFPNFSETAGRPRHKKTYSE